MRHSGAVVHTFELPGGQVVAGSNPVSPTRSAQVKSYLHLLLILAGLQHSDSRSTTAPNRRTDCSLRKLARSTASCLDSDGPHGPRRLLRESLTRKSARRWPRIRSHAEHKPSKNAVAAKRFFRELLEGLRTCRASGPDKPGSYQVADRALMSSVRAPAVAVSEEPRRELSSAHPTTRTGDETLQIVAACATVPVCLQRHLRTLPAATASAQRDRMANRDGRPLRGLASGHRARRCRLKCERPNGVPSRLLQTQLRHYTFQST